MIRAGSNAGFSADTRPFAGVVDLCQVREDFFLRVERLPIQGHRNVVVRWRLHAADQRLDVDVTRLGITHTWSLRSERSSVISDLSARRFSDRGLVEIQLHPDLVGVATRDPARGVVPEVVVRAPW